MRNETRWVGFDLDGTLAYTPTEWGDGSVIGEPIPKMVNYAKELIAEGVKVKIFTARVGVVKNPEVRNIHGRWPDETFAKEQTALIQAWCFKNLGTILEVTAVKDHLCEAIFDDRAVAVTRDGFNENDSPFDGAGMKAFASVWRGIRSLYRGGN